jgi:hypothetical protein
MRSQRMHVTHMPPTCTYCCCCSTACWRATSLAFDLTQLQAKGSCQLGSSQRQHHSWQLVATTPDSVRDIFLRTAEGSSNNAAHHGTSSSDE